MSKERFPTPTWHDVDAWPKIAAAIREVRLSDDVQISVWDKGSKILKFGRNEDVDTSYEDVMTLAGTETAETLPNIQNSTNYITTISSSNAGDTQTIFVSGNTVANNVLTRVTQTVTLQGQTQVSLTTPLARVWRAANTAATDLAGTVYIYEDDTATSGVPDTAAKVHLIIPLGDNQSQKCAISTEDGVYLLLTNFGASIIERTATLGEVRLQVRSVNGVWRTQWNIGISAGARDVEPFEPLYIVPPNTDIKIQAVSGSANTDVVAGFQGYFARIIPDGS